MPNVTLAVSDELKRKMDELPEINWSEVARKAIRDKVEEFDLFRAVVSRSRLTEDDAIRLGREIKRSLHERYKKRYGGLA